MEIISQPIVEEQTPQAFESRHVEEEVELQQPLSKDSGEEFLQELVCSVILECQQLRTKTMMKRKRKMPIEEKVEKPIKKKIMSKAKET